jgi:hypothetical protein
MKALESMTLDEIKAELANPKYGEIDLAIQAFESAETKYEPSEWVDVSVWGRPAALTTVPSRRLRSCDLLGEVPGDEALPCSSLAA